MNDYKNDIAFIKDWIDKREKRKKGIIAVFVVVTFALFVLTWLLSPFIILSSDNKFLIYVYLGVFALIGHYIGGLFIMLRIGGFAFRYGGFKI